MGISRPSKSWSLLSLQNALLMNKWRPWNWLILWHGFRISSPSLRKGKVKQKSRSEKTCAVYIYSNMKPWQTARAQLRNVSSLYSTKCKSTNAVVCWFLKEQMRRCKTFVHLHALRGYVEDTHTALWNGRHTAWTWHNELFYAHTMISYWKPAVFIMTKEFYHTTCSLSILI